MKLYQRFASVALIGALFTTLLSGCSASDATSEEGYFLDENGKSVTIDSIATINESKVPLTEFRYYFLNRKAGYLNQFGGSSSASEGNQDFIASIREDALEDIKFDRALRQFAADNGIALSEEDLKAVQADIEETKNAQGAEAFDKALLDSFLTLDTYQYILESNALQQKIQEEIQNDNGKFSTSQEDAKSFFEKNYLRSKHILIMTEGITAEDELKKKEADAQAILERAKAGEDFDALIEECGEDPGMESNPDGYYFVEGEMVPEFYEGTLALQPGEISGLVQSSFGYHIIQRLPLEESYFTANEAQFRGTLAAEKINEQLQTMMDQAKVETAPEFDQINDKNLV